MTGRRAIALILLLLSPAWPAGHAQLLMTSADVINSLLAARASGDLHRGAAAAACVDCPGLRLNEFLPKPMLIDWNHDGSVSNADEWIELYNPGDVACDLTGWRLACSSSSYTWSYTIPSGALAAQGYCVFYRSQTGIQMHDSAGEVWLWRPDGSLVESWKYPSTSPDRSYSRTADTWTQWWPPSPGEENRPPTATPTASGTVTATGTPTPSPTPSATATATPTRTRTASPTRTPSATRTASATRTPSPSPTGTPSPTAVFTATPTATATMQPEAQGLWCLLLPIVLGDVGTAPTPTLTEVALPTPTMTATGTPTPTPTAPGPCNYVGNSSTLKFHYPSCTYASRISAEHRVCFASCEDAIAEGYVPCQVCKPCQGASVHERVGGMEDAARR